jgi:DNA-binding winged helix-turn-helix (wHTH) protein/TolB-like protein
MDVSATDRWKFGDFVLDTNKKTLRRSGARVDMPMKELELLCMLVRHRGELVTKDELFEEIWEDSFVGENNLSRHVYLLRRTLKELGADDGLIENVPRRGYRFTGEVLPVDPDEIRVEKHTHTRTVVELPPDSSIRSRSRIRLAGYSLAVALLIGFVGYFGYRNSVTGPGKAISSLAVLPFRTIGNTGDPDFHSGAGLADTLTTRLSNVKALRIRPLNAVASYRDADPIAAGKELGVDAVIDGTIYYSGERVRVTAKLVNVDSASVIWSGEFERLKAEELSLHHDLAIQIVPVIASNLDPAEHSAIAKKYTQDADAYALYLKARYEWNKRSYPAMIEAQRLFRNAIAADPKFALAYVGLADTLLTNQGSAPEGANLITRALEIDPTMAEAHASRGFYLMFYEWNWSEAESAFKRSIEINRNYPTAHHWYATLLSIRGEFDSAKSEMHMALELDPSSHNFLADLGQLYYFSGDYAEAESYCLRALQIYPDFAFAHEYLHYIYLKTGQHEKAIGAIARSDEINGSFVLGTAAQKYDPLTEYRNAFQRSGIKGYFDHKYPGTPAAPDRYYFYAIKHAVTNERERALDYLERSVRSRAFLAAFMKANPIFEELREEPRYREILQTMGLS